MANVTLPTVGGRWPVIRKTPADSAVTPNLTDYARACAEFSWRQARTLLDDVLGFARVRLGTAVAPKEIEFLPSIPKNRAGKIMRRLLKARELGLPEGDISTVEAS
jgi:acyl-CoA synthetase (AMP-forming)/AMP-acid ligase II